MNLLELEQATVEWSTERGIITNGKAITQVAKLTSEFGELCKHLHSAEIDECIDDLGDMCVVLTNLSRLVGAGSLQECEPDFNDSREGILVLGDYLGRLNDNIIKNEFDMAKTNIGNCVYQLIVLAITDCKKVLYFCWE